MKAQQTKRYNFFKQSTEKFPISNIEKSVLIEKHKNNVAVFFSEMDMLDENKSKVLNYINDLQYATTP